MQYRTSQGIEVTEDLSFDFGGEEMSLEVDYLQENVSINFARGKFFVERAGNPTGGIRIVDPRVPGRVRWTGLPADPNASDLARNARNTPRSRPSAVA